MQRNLQSRQDFNRMTNQRTQDFTMRSMQGSRSGQRNADMVKQAQAKQQQLEKEANEKLAQLAQEQQRKREQHPAANPQQAALQQKKDEKQLTLLTVKNYRDVFLGGQLSKALQTQRLAPQAQQQLDNLITNLADKAWWKQQSGAQLTAAIQAYSDTLSALTTGLLGFDLTSPPAMPARLSADNIRAQLATDVFDQNVANQLIRDAALMETLSASESLIKSVREFSRVSTAVASPELQRNPKKVQAVQAGLHQVNQAMNRYNARIDNSTSLIDVQTALTNITTTYIKKSSR